MGGSPLLPVTRQCPGFQAINTNCERALSRSTPPPGQGGWPGARASGRLAGPPLFHSRGSPIPWSPTGPKVSRTGFEVKGEVALAPLWRRPAELGDPPNPCKHGPSLLQARRQLTCTQHPKSSSGPRVAGLRSPHGRGPRTLGVCLPPATACPVGKWGSLAWGHRVTTGCCLQALAVPGFVREGGGQKRGGKGGAGARRCRAGEGEQRTGAPPGPSGVTCGDTVLHSDRLEPTDPLVQDGAPFFLFPLGAHGHIEATLGQGDRPPSPGRL